MLRTRSALIAAAASIAIVAAVVPASAGSATAVTFTAATTFSDPPVPDAFTSSIPECSTGTVVNGDFRARFLPGDRGVFNGTKEFTCTGGDSGFDVALIARFGPGGSVGSWQIVDGWGELDGLAGSGSLAGVGSDSGITDVYVGRLR